MELSHIKKNNCPGMVNVSEKKTTCRKARALSKLRVKDEVSQLFCDGEYQSKKGPVIQTAILAATMAVKRTSDLIPLCHPINIEGIDVDIQLIAGVFEISVDVSTSGKTGVEMEALLGANIGALTLYDMLKSMGHEMEIISSYLVSKSGGKNDFHLQQ